jgi:hypothetical protein
MLFFINCERKMRILLIIMMLLSATKRLYHLRSEGVTIISIQNASMNRECNCYILILRISLC